MYHTIILKSLLHSRLTPVIDTQLQREQAGFRRGRSTVDQIKLLTQDIEDSFQVNENAGVVLLDVTSACDTAWLRGLHLKFPKTTPDKHLVNFIMEILTNRSFALDHYQQRTSEQAEKTEERRHTRFGACTAAIQHLHPRPAENNFQQVRLR